MKDFLHHLFLPRESNNHRAKILHHNILFFIIAALFLSQFFLSFVKTNFEDVLGISTNISIDRLIELTNQKRAEQGLSPVTFNSELSNAAHLKAKDMYEKNYWAHNSPDGLTPWVFIKQSGYEYVYAGENLARGFTTSEEAIDAWMASPSHRENVLSGNYKEIGFAVMEGNLLGEETVLIVEMFGSRISPTLAKEVAPQQDIIVQETFADIITPTIIPTLIKINPLENAPQETDYKPKSSFVASWETKPLVNPRNFTKNVSFILLLLFIFVLILDMVIIERKKIIRVVGHNIDHILFLSIILIFIIIFTRESIL